MVFVDPSGTIPISLTGKFCHMNCAHCGGHYLSHMKTLREMDQLAKEGRRSFLISGGLEEDFLVPFRKHLHQLRYLKETYELSYNFHVGFPQSPVIELEGLADVVSFDFFADPKVMEAVYGFSVEPTKLLDAIARTRVVAVPHITVGILEGHISHEYEALKMLSERFNVVVLNVFVPTPGTKFSQALPPDLLQVKELFSYAAENFEHVILGCMQPRGEYRRSLQQSVKDFVSVIVKPVFKVDFDFKGCCALWLAKSKVEVVKHVR
ncbi:radical SAM protein [Pseudothermotoga hypogea DSM 11164 = NBRC 106472]|uniref:Radical SAM protein n=1 Tax=Pseudothermotoga hypogea DSM 11164 = NBRC 106472 TaxID=1123384 RepID=A0A0X1KTP4_9THEM|nr:MULTISPECIES: radical SAM protein [Pseudothermotoga]AJC74566.1 radical SAM protein [Pseudothermotoga hypogea DSM 11164 = NBRC 106472]MBC7122574.1 radical SAM protein [Pseudothermotoga sp.]MDI6862671.1 radical SAM protein [Pseudothermotoga sp.]